MTGLLRFAMAAVVATIVGQAPAGQTGPPSLAAGPAVVIESFGPVRAYAVGAESFWLVGSFRNTGKDPIPAGTCSARLHALSGLEYVEGDTIPKLGALEPGAVVSYKWKLQPTSPTSALLAALVLEQPGVRPTAVTLPIQHFATQPRGDSPALSAIPTARANGSGAVVENSKVRARVVVTNANVPVIFLSVRQTGGWRPVGVVMPIADLLSAEGMQHPWWEVFKGAEFASAVEKDRAAIAVSGGWGLRWRGTIDLTLRTNSSVVDVRVRVSPQRDMRLFGVRLAPFYVGDGSFGAEAAETLDPTSAGPNTASAVRWGEVTTGLLWPSDLLGGGWATRPLASPGGVDYRRLGVETLSPRTQPVLLRRGAMVTMRARLFAFAGSSSVRDALKVTLPAEPPMFKDPTIAPPVDESGDSPKDNAPASPN